MGEAGHPWRSIGSADERADAGNEAPQVRMAALWDSIAQSLDSEALGKAATEYSSFEETAQLAFDSKGARFSRFGGPITATSRLVSEAVGLVAASADAAAAVLRLAPQLLPHVSGASPAAAWGLVKVIETALWCLDEQEFTLLRAGRLLLLGYLQSQHTVLNPQHALAMSLFIAPLSELHAERLASSTSSSSSSSSSNSSNSNSSNSNSSNSSVPLVVQLLVKMGQQSAEVEECKSRKSIESLYWSECHYTRLAVNAVYGVRAATLRKLIVSRLTPSQTVFNERGSKLSSESDLVQIVAVMLLVQWEPTQELELGISAIDVTGPLLHATNTYGRIDGPALAVKNKLGLTIDSSVWLLARQGLPPPLRDNTYRRDGARVGSECAVAILCAGTRLYPPHTCIGACLLLRSHARSVHSLRTEEVVRVSSTEKLCAALKRLLIEEPENGVGEAVTGLLCNLLVEFSRLREPLIGLGIIPAMCEALQRNPGREMLVNTLWALRNVCALHDAVEVEQASLQSLDRVGALRPLLASEDREVARLFCGLLGNVSPGNIGELSRLLGGRKVVVKYLAERLESWQWPSVQEAASQALANLTAVFMTEDVKRDGLSRDVCQGIARCLQHPRASPALLANIGYMISNALMMPEYLVAARGEGGSAKDSEWRCVAQKSLGRQMLEEGVYDALTQVESQALSVRNSLASAEDALRKAGVAVDN